MPGGTQLCPKEQGQIGAMKKVACSNSQIAKTIKRSPKVVQTFLSSPKTYALKTKTGELSKLSAEGRRLPLTQLP